MKTPKKDNQGSAGQVVRIGNRAYRVYSKIVVEEVDCSDAEVTGSTVHQGADGGFEMHLSDDEATSIDKSEQAILQTAWPAMREALAQHMAAVSKKKPKSQ
jgi:hypothetical protein